MTATIALGPDLPPAIPCYAGIYLSNLWYGHQIILLEHMRLDPARVALPGKVQHGWQPGTGLDYEQGMRLEVTHGRDPFFVWGRRQLDNARAAGLGWGKAIGAPFLYIAPQASPPFRERSGLLAFPTHSVNADMMVQGWQTYADDLAARAKAEGFAQATVCLGYRDWQDEVRTVFADRGVATACLGGPFNRRFLHDFIALVEAASAVVSDRACSAGFYAMWLGRPFSVSGTPLLSPGNELGPAGDPEWLATHIPELAGGRFSASKSVAMRELGAEFVCSPEDLFARLFLPGFQRWGSPPLWVGRPNWEDVVNFCYPEAPGL